MLLMNLIQKWEKLKIKLRNTCGKYCQYQCWNAVDILAKRKDITILKEDKGGGVAVIDKSKNTKKCLKAHSKVWDNFW